MSASSFYNQLEAQNQELPPVELWNPPLSGEMDCVISRDGSWHIDGSELHNFRLQRLLSKVLKLEDGEYFLVSPVEKWRIEVEDHPFMIVEITMIDAETENQVLRVRNNIGDWQNIDETHSISTSVISGLDEDVLVPFVVFRQGLGARFNRNSHLQLAEFLEVSDTDNEYLLSSSGHTFNLHF